MECLRSGLFMVQAVRAEEALGGYRVRGGDDGGGYRHNRHSDIISGWVIITN